MVQVADKMKLSPLKLILTGIMQNVIVNIGNDQSMQISVSVSNLHILTKIYNKKLLQYIP